MKKINRLQRVLSHSTSIESGNKGKANFEMRIRSPIEEPARDIRSADRSIRSNAACKLTDIASDRYARLDAMEALRELGKAAREHEDEVSTAFIERFGVETFQELINATAKRNNMIFGTVFAGSVAMMAAGFSMGSTLMGIAGISVFGAALSRFVVKGSALNIFRMSKSDAWEILEKHEFRQLEQKNK